MTHGSTALDWRGGMVASLALHGGLAALVIFGATLLHGPGARWGSIDQTGDALSATLVSGIPLPATQQQTDNVLANDSAGLSQTQPQVAPPEPKAIPIPEHNVPAKPAPRSSAVMNRPVPNQPPPPPNLVPFGKGGPVSGPYGSFHAGGAQGGFGVTGAGGDFGTLYAWYVRVVQQKITENWLRYEVDPSIHEGKRVYVTFDITRSGQPGNVRLSQTSGIPSLDQSAVRAVQRVDTFGQLPAGYSGDKVSVEFWFDYKR